MPRLHHHRKKSAAIHPSFQLSLIYSCACRPSLSVNRVGANVERHVIKEWMQCRTLPFETLSPGFILCWIGIDYCDELFTIGPILLVVWTLTFVPVLLALSAVLLLAKFSWQVVYYWASSTGSLNSYFCASFTGSLCSFFGKIFCFPKLLLSDQFSTRAYFLSNIHHTVHYIIWHITGI